MLKVLKVCRDRSSGKLIADLENGYVLTLNSDLTFSEKVPQRIDRNTTLETTHYRIEVEVGTQGKHKTYQIIRTWEIDQMRLLGATGFETIDIDALINEKHRSPKSADPNAPIEDRIDISMSEEFSENEKRYVGQSAGHPAGFILMVASFFLLIMAGLWGWWPPILAFVAGAWVICDTRTPGDSSKIKEVRDAKERLRKQEEDRRREAMIDVQVWEHLNGVQFERAVAEIFREKGFDVEFTPQSNDKGVDLIIKKDSAVSIVQCKAYKKGNVGVGAVRELVGVRASWPNAEETFLVALFDFSRGAKEFAAEQNIKLVSIAKDYLKTDYRPDESTMNTEHYALLPEKARLAQERDKFVAEVGIKGMTDLHIAAGLNLPLLTKSLLDQGVDVHARDEKGHTPLHYAAWRNASETAAVLLNNGADVHATDEKSATPLHSAALGNACTTVKVLLSNGADVHTKDEKDHTPLHYAADGNASETASVLLNNGADVHAKNKDCKTPLHLVASRNAYETAEILLNNGADVHARDATGTPLHWAAWENASETAAVLLNNGADVHAKGKDVGTPLHVAALKNASETASVLLSNGADVHAKAKDGVTPLQVAEVFKTHKTAAVMNNHLINPILATGDGSRERPYVVSSVKEEYLILEHFNKIKTMQMLMDVDGKPMDCIGCEDGATYHFDISTFFRRLR